MGSLACELWNPEDDALLKNAIETGGSLEALARGAVRFSRQYTLQELRSRWQSILFDNDTSEMASQRILEVDGDSGIPTKPRQNQSLKRNIESLRCHYNTIRKRVCNGRSNFQRYNFDMSTANDLPIENGHCDGQVRPSEQLFEYCFPENQFHVDYDIQEPGDPKHLASFPDMMGIDHESIDVGGDHMDPLKGRFEDDVFCGDNLYEHVNDALPMPEEKVTTGNVDPSYENLTDNKDAPCIFKETLGTFLNCSGVGSPQGLGTDMETKPFPVSGPIDCNHEIHDSTICSSFDKNMEEAKTEFMDCSNSFHHEQYSSPIPEMPIWEAIDGISSPIMNIIGGLEEKDNDTGTPLNLPIDVVEKTEPADGNHIPLKTNFPEHNNAVQQQGDLTSIPMTFTNDGEFFTCMDRSCFESINNFLMNSPNDVHRDDNTNSNEPKSRVMDEYNQIEQPASVGESKDVDADVVSVRRDGNNDSGPTHKVPHVSQDTAAYSKLHQRFDCCVLNMEDPEIPCNDGIIIDRSIVSTIGPINVWSGSKETSLGKSCKSILDERNPTLLNIPRENQEVSARRFESRSIITKAGDGSHAAQMHCLSIDGACKQELEMPSSAQVTIPFHEKPYLVDQEPQQIASTSDQEIKYADSDLDAPCFSDVEAIILDMDLDSDDQESFIYTKEVAWCQRADIRKALVRLEQGASSSMQRNISNHGAFAVFYGRYLKHYIKKSKVLLGRATRESEVDIDLTKEALTNKISRHQAIIELDDNGSFFIKNLGKCSMFINGKEVLRGKCCKLSPMCLIEIRSMAFSFEVNSDCIRKYQSSLSRKMTQARNSNFDWSAKS